MKRLWWEDSSCSRIAIGLVLFAPLFSSGGHGQSIEVNAGTRIKSIINKGVLADSFTSSGGQLVAKGIQLTAPRILEVPPDIQLVVEYWHESTISGEIAIEGPCKISVIEPARWLLLLGKIRLSLKQYFQVDTKEISFGPRGTAFDVRVDPTTLDVRSNIEDGSIGARDKANPGRELVVSAGNYISFRGGKFSAVEIGSLRAGIPSQVAAIDTARASEDTVMLRRHPNGMIPYSPQLFATLPREVSMNGMSSIDRVKLYLDAGNPEQARRILDTRNYSPIPERYGERAILIADSLLLLKRFNEARAAYATILENERENCRARTGLAIAAFRETAMGVAKYRLAIIRQIQTALLDRLGAMPSEELRRSAELRRSVERAFDEQSALMFDEEVMRSLPRLLDRAIQWSQLNPGNQIGKCDQGGDWSTATITAELGHWALMRRR